MGRGMPWYTITDDFDRNFDVDERSDQVERGIAAIQGE
jgi:hypothetical protein